MKHPIHHPIFLTKKNLLILCIFFLSNLLSSCDRRTPAGFWASFKKDLIVKEISDQGLRGGHRAIYWHSDKPNTFQSETVIEFATKNGWSLTDSSSFVKDTVSKWLYLDQPIFPLSHTGFDPSVAVVTNTYSDFPRWINSDVRVYTFKTPWLAIEPGTDESIDENGFIVINDNSSEMSAYHLWGE